VIALSPIRRESVNLYGATKLASDKLFVAANTPSALTGHGFLSSLWERRGLARVGVPFFTS